MIKRRLEELDKLQKQISEADAKEFKKIGQAQQNLTEEGQRILREKLMELTEQMKNRWKERQSHHDDQQYSSKSSISEVEIVSSRKESSKNPPQIQPQSLLQVEDAGGISLSEVSDVTEIKSLSENPRNVSEANKTNDSSRTWKERLQDVEVNDDTKYRSLDVEKLRQSKNPTPLTDEIPERDESENKSQKLRQIVSEVFERHKNDLEYIRNTVDDIDVPDTPAVDLGQEFEPKFPTILSSAHDPRPVPTSLLDSQETLDSEKPPQWMEVTKDNSEAENDDDLDETKVNQATNLTSTVYKDLARQTQQSQLSDTSYIAPAKLTAVNQGPSAQLTAVNPGPSAQLTSAIQGPSSVNPLTPINQDGAPPLPSFKLGPTGNVASSVLGQSSHNLTSKETGAAGPLGPSAHHLTSCEPGPLGPSPQHLTSCEPGPLGPSPPVAASSPELVQAGQVTGDKHNFMNSVLRKYQVPAPNNTSIPSNLAISEGT